MNWGSGAGSEDEGLEVLDERLNSFLASKQPGEVFTLDELVTFIWPELDEATAREWAYEIGEDVEAISG